MAMYRQWQPAPDCTCAIWKIEETERFFSDYTGLHSTIKSEQRRLEFLAGRFLLKHLVPELNLFNISTSAVGKPFLMNDALPYFSISHSYPFVAVAISQVQHVGIDVQVYQSKIVRLQHKFLSEKEQQLCTNEVEKLTIAWCTKEAVFKKFALHAVDFIEHMPISELHFNKEDVLGILEYKRLQPAATVPLIGACESGFAWMLAL